MARKVTEDSTVEELLSPDEIELFHYGRQGDWFIQEGWNQYGPDWENHLPRDPNSDLIYINALSRYLFNFAFQDFQAALYYCPIPDRMIIGARGSGKTTVVAITLALIALLNPGLDWLHVAPSLEQARVMYDVILTWGAQGHFNRLFLKHARTSPAPDIELRPWNQYDPGTHYFFRSIGAHGGQPMELLRSLEAATISADEAFRLFESDYYVPILVGMSRGPNRYILNSRPGLAEKYRQFITLIEGEQDHRARQKLETELEKLLAQEGAAKQFSITLSGNAGIWPCWWSRFKWGEDHPDKRWSQRWISKQNLYFTREQQAFLAQQFEGNPDGLQVEMFAQRPLISGGVFSAAYLNALADEELDRKAREAVEQDVPGWKYIKHPEWGLVNYREPAEKGVAYAAGTDPGTGKLPNRNCWVLLWCRLDGPPFKIVGLESGNLSWKGQGTLAPWIAAVKEMMALYRFPEGHIAAEASGPQKGVHEVVWPDELEIVPLIMSTIKPTLIMQAQLMLSRSMFVRPMIDMLHTQLIAYEYADKKLDQDFVMAFLALVAVVWPYVEDRFELQEVEPDEETYWTSSEAQRDIRDLSRESRERR